ncbi:MAG: DUF3107 domain-containing protein [Antricoccus sp.]
MDIKIGVLHTPREIVLDSTQSQEEVATAVSDALGSSDGMLRLTDKRGRLVMVPTDRIAYVEIAEADNRRVGFGTSD